MALTEEERRQRRRESQRRYRESHKDKIKEYSKMYNKKYYWENKEENRERHNQEERERYNKNKDKICETIREHYANDDEYRNKIITRNSEFRNENPQVMKTWREGHKEEISEYNKEYSKTQRGRANNLLSSYRTNDKLHKRGECTITADWIIENIFTKSCVYGCGESDWRKLGCDRKDNSLPHTPENCVPCCLSCNSKKGSMSYDEYMAKILGEGVS